MENKTSIGQKWTQEEDDQLNQLYNNENLDVVEIAEKHNRLPGGIAARLVHFGIVSNRMDARGYSGHKNSEYYITTMAEKKINKVSSHETNNNNSFYKKKNKIEEPDYVKIQKDITEIKQDIKKLSSNMNELIDMLKSIYEFEDVVV
jgi:hypothetical protein